MKISARVRDEWLQVPCKDGEGIFIIVIISCVIQVVFIRSFIVLFLLLCLLPLLGNVTVGWLAEEAVRRYTRIIQHNGHNNALQPVDSSTLVSNNNLGEQVVEIRKTRGCVRLDPDDLVVDVLDDNDFVSVRLENDIPELPNSGAAGPVLGSDPQFLPAVNRADQAGPLMTEDDIVLDGLHLTVKDLVLLSKGRNKIRLRKISEDRVAAGRNLVESILKENKVIFSF